METLELQLRQIRLEAEGIASFELARPDGQALPAITAGAHLDIHLPNGLRRSYSISSAPDIRSHYRITVKRDAASRGGSDWLHDNARVGMRVVAGEPRNNFALDESARHHVLIAGGIGITPLLPMLWRLNALQRSWTLHYSARTPGQMAHDAELRSLACHAGAKVMRYFTAQGERMKLREIVDGSPANSHFYGCGPASLIDAFTEATQGIAPRHVSLERFAASEAPSAGGYAVRLARDGRQFDVPPGQSMLDTLLAAGLEIPYSCMQGICGSCSLRVLDGLPDHRDECLSEEERKSGQVVMPCCSGARTPVLVLDL